MLRRLLILTALVAAPAQARDALGVFGQWAVFRDTLMPRCYAIAMPQSATQGREFQPFASVGWWPRQKTNGQVHFRLSRKLQPGAPVTLTIAGKRVALVGGGADAWAADKLGDAMVMAAMRSAPEMAVSGRDSNGKAFTNRYKLDGVATAMDAAAVGCAQLR